jgi:excisionase family DNA binding protein
MTTKQSRTSGAPFGESFEGQKQVPSSPDDHQPLPGGNPLSLQRTSNRGEPVSGGADIQFGFAAASQEALPLRSGPIHSSNSVTSSRTNTPRSSASNLPMTVKDAATFLGVSPQTVYLWVERKQIPHLRVMGRNIRFLRSDLEPFRAQFRQEVANAETA